jgi:hypothetical protein
MSPSGIRSLVDRPFPGVHMQHGGDEADSDSEEPDDHAVADTYVTERAMRAYAASRGERRLHDQQRHPAGIYDAVKMQDGRCIGGASQQRPVVRRPKPDRDERRHQHRQNDVEGPLGAPSGYAARIPQHHRSRISLGHWRSPQLESKPTKDSLAAAPPQAKDRELDRTARRTRLQSSLERRGV